MGNKICCCFTRKPLLDYSELEVYDLDNNKLTLPKCFQKKISELPKTVR